MIRKGILPAMLLAALVLTAAVPAQAGPAGASRWIVSVIDNANQTNPSQGLSPQLASGGSPGLYVQVLDGLVVVTNTGGSGNLSPSMFGYQPPAWQAPPATVPGVNQPFQQPPQVGFPQGITQQGMQVINASNARAGAGQGFAIDDLVFKSAGTLGGAQVGPVVSSDPAPGKVVVPPTNVPNGSLDNPFQLTMEETANESSAFQYVIGQADYGSWQTQSEQGPVYIVVNSEAEGSNPQYVIIDQGAISIREGGFT